MNKAKIFVSAAAVLAAGCSHSGTVSKIATDYNRAMATTRDEQLLINILRAAGREPLMFSAVGEVTGTAQDSLSLQTAATALLAGGKNTITPTLGMEGSSGPTVKVTPLSSKEFTEGVLQPIKPSTLNYFMNQGWDAEFLLPLILSGYQCTGKDEVNLNDADADKLARWGEKFSVTQRSAKPPLADITLLVSDAEALRMMRHGGPNGYTVKSVTDHPENSGTSKVVLAAPAVRDVTVTVTDAEALEMMRTGVAAGYKVKAVSEASDPAKAMVVLTVPDEKVWEAVFGGEGPECGTGVTKAYSVVDQPDKTEIELREAAMPSLQFRSVEGIIYYLGAAYRRCFLGKTDGCSITYSKPVKPHETKCLEEAGLTVTGDKFPRTLFRLHSAGQPPAVSAIHARHNGDHYWVNRLDRCDMDRTLKTLSFLSQLIALQTNASDLVVTPSVIAVGGR